MAEFWYWVVAAMITIYVILDGYDLGAGMAQLVLCKSPGERHQVLETIHPLWDGNEVWLVAGGTTLFFAFPKLYAISFSGFYLPLMIVLWLLILRGISIEFRNQINSCAWQPFWDTLFGAASAGLALFFGTALGNVVRGVPLDSSGQFFLPLWTHLSPTADVGIIDWYTISIGVAACLTLLMHGTLWISHRTKGEVEIRATSFARRLWPVLLAVTIAITFLSFHIQNHLFTRFTERPWGLIFPLLGFCGLIGIRLWNSTTASWKPFASSCLFILGLMTSAAFGLFPYVLPSTSDTGMGLTAQNAVAPAGGLQIGLYWFIPGITLAVLYSVYAHTRFSGKISIGEHEP